MGGNVNVSISDIENWNKYQITEYDEVFEVSYDNNRISYRARYSKTKVCFPEAVGDINTLIKWYEEIMMQIR